MKVPAPDRNPVPEYEPGLHPFTTEAEVLKYAGRLAAERIHEAKRVFDVLGPCSVRIDSTSVKFLGMESFYLTDVVLLPIEDVRGGFEPRFFFEAKDVIAVPRLDGLRTMSVVNMFGGEVVDYVAEELDRALALPNVVAIRKEVNDAEMRAKYGKNLNYGSFA